MSEKADEQVCECGRPEKSWIHFREYHPVDSPHTHAFRLPKPSTPRKPGSCVYCGIEVDNGLACAFSPVLFTPRHQMQKLIFGA